jgi:2-keto-4-pentenoate hydratase/2-oxohepta-3-ene-1,7-dioic acid hydratase in catechol pathway
LACADSTSGEERVLPGPQLRRAREGKRTGARARNEDPNGAGDLHEGADVRQWPFDDIAVDRQATQQVDWEVELGVVIGASGRNIARTDALRHVFVHGHQRPQRT